MSYLDRVARFVPPDLGAYLAFRVDGRDVGHIAPAFARHLAEFPRVFDIDARTVTLAERFSDFGSRSEAVDGVVRALARNGVLSDWREERYRVGVSFGAPPLLAIERAAVPRFGVRAYGVHVNGFVRGSDGRLGMWIGTRAKERGIAPGKLDQIVAGGQPVGLGVLDNLIKECGEEASIPSALAARAKPAGAVFYTVERPEGLRRDFLFIYDLELPADFIPRNADGEIERFELMPLEKVAAIVQESDDFKFNCALVVIDFMIRHGFIPGDHPDYAELVAGMHCYG